MLVFLFTLFYIQLYAQLPIIPCESGFGINTVAGSGRHLSPARTTVIKVTNLNASGPGSLDAAIKANYPRVVVFEVSGTIRVDGRLGIWNPYLTIAGQTAPSPGITLRGGTVEINTHDVLIQHIRVRIGDQGGIDPSNRDGIQIHNKGYNVVVDHCSVSWTIDEEGGTWGTDTTMVEEVTFNNCIFGEALYESIHPEGIHSMGLFFGYNTKRASAIRNMFVHTNQRLPMIRDRITDVVVANNLIYNYGQWIHCGIDIRDNNGDRNRPLRASIMSNHSIKGTNSVYGKTVIIGAYYNKNLTSNSQIYTDDNRCYDGVGLPCVLNQASSSVLVTSPPISIPTYTPVASEDVQGIVLSFAGARPADRDTVDRRYVNDVINGTGSIINSQFDVGGWPELAQNTRTLKLPKNLNGDDDSDGYTNLEEWLHAYNDTVQGINICGGLTPTNNTIHLAKSVSEITVYPNPTNGPVFINSSGAIDGLIVVTIYNMLGNIVYQETMDGLNIQDGGEMMNISSLPSGIYVFSITGKDVRTIRKKIYKK